MKATKPTLFFVVTGCIALSLYALSSHLIQASAMTNATGAPLTVSENGKYLLDAQGEPFLFRADTAWDIHHRLTREEIEIYLDDRQEKGVNVIMFRIPFRDLEGEPQRTNRYGDTPFIEQDIMQPSESFFELVDFTLIEMEKRGMIAGFLPLWGFVVGGRYGFNVSDEDVAGYGQWLSNRYKERSNIIWISGGDTGSDPKWEILGRALKQADPQKLVTFHPGRTATSSFDLFADADWLDFHMVQTGHSPNLTTNYLSINDIYNRSSKPVVNGEPAYEDIVVVAPQGNYHMPPHQVRKAIYWSLLAGGMGPAYGHVEIFQFAGAMPGQPYTYGANGYWMDALDAPAAIQLSNLISFLNSIPWHTYVPRQSLIATANSIGPSHIRAAISSDNSRALVYFPEQQSANIALSELGEPLHARWFDPRSGIFQDAGSVPASGTIAFSAPFDEDSLLVLEPADDPGASPSPTPPSATGTFATPSPSPSYTATATDTCQAQPGDILSNGNFEQGTDAWYFSTEGRGNFTTVAPAYACDLAARVRIIERGANTQLYQPGVTLKANTAYRLRFAAYSTSGKGLKAELLKHGTPYTNYGLSESVELSTNWRSYSVEFTTRGFGGLVDDGRFRFRLNGSTGDTYWIDAVTLEELTENQPTASATPLLASTATATPWPPPPSPTPAVSDTPDPVLTVTATITSTSTHTSTPTPTPIATGPPGCLAVPGELVANGHFEEGSRGWRFYTGGRGTFATSAPAYNCAQAARINIVQRNSNTQLYQVGVSLQAGVRYRLSFAAYSQSGHDLAAELIKHTSPYNNYGLSQTFNLTTGWQLYTVDFDAAGFDGTKSDGRLRFRLSAANNDVYWIDAVSLIAVESLPPLETPDPTDTVTPALSSTATSTPKPPTASQTPTMQPADTATPDQTATPPPPTPTPTPPGYWDSACDPPAGDVLQNGNFEAGTNGWHFWSGGRGYLTASAPAYSCDLAGRIRINVRGTIMQVYQHSVNLKANTAYRLSFAAYSQYGRDLMVELLKHTTPYTNYGLAQTVNLGTEWQLYTIDFTTSGFEDAAVDDGRLRFRLYAGNNDTYWIDAVSLQEVGPAISTSTAPSFFQQLLELLKR